ncbi:hypothetical protein [Streptacidiphilus anmyonensis]|nr:hypothetical protein [Streptacidiphilus anmyonensis]
MALVSFVGVAAAVYLKAGSGGLSAVTTAGGGLFMAWRSRK